MIVSKWAHLMLSMLTQQKPFSLSFFFCSAGTQKGGKPKQQLCVPTLATALDGHRRNSKDPGQSKHQKQITSAVHPEPTAEKKTAGHRIDAEWVKVIVQHHGLTNFKEADCIFPTEYGFTLLEHHYFHQWPWNEDSSFLSTPCPIGCLNHFCIR